MRPRHAPTGAGALALGLALLAGACGASSAARPDLEAARPRSIRFTGAFVDAGLERTVDSTGTLHGTSRWRIGLSIANSSRAARWVEVRFPGSVPGRDPAASWWLEPKRQHEFTCALDTVLADLAYPVDVAVYADSAGSDTVETIATSLSFAQYLVQPHVAAVRNEWKELPLRALPVTIAPVRWIRSRIDLRTLLSPGAPGTLVVTPDTLAYDDPRTRLRIPSTEVTGISEPQATKVEVAYREGTHKKQLALGVMPSLFGALRDDRVLLHRIKMAVQEQIDRARRVSPAEPSWASSSRTDVSVFHRRGPFLGLGGGVGMFAGSGDSLEYTRAGGLPASLSFGTFISPSIAIGARVETMLAFTQDLYLLPPVAIFGGDLQYWSGEQWVLAVAAGPTWTIASEHTALGIPVRFGTRIPNVGRSSLGSFVGIEYFPVFHRDASAWTVALVIETMRTPGGAGRRNRS